MAWNADQLDAIAGAQELHISSYRTDGTLRKAIPIWVVRVDDDLYIRSAFGESGAWFRHASTGTAHVSAGGVESDAMLERISDDALNRRVADAYSAKYRGQTTGLTPMLEPTAAVTTSRLIPA
ncbi:DUF2255 family protein [Gordonia sp. VNQ95]|uniref:DUF2255 family protein n=1 Tax=Gordonia sp. VNQ95 TaxID=3156619 RepID=UPI0032B451C7